MLSLNTLHLHDLFVLVQNYLLHHLALLLELLDLKRVHVGDVKEAQDGGKGHLLPESVNHVPDVLLAVDTDLFQLFDLERELNFLQDIVRVWRFMRLFEMQPKRLGL